MIIKENNFTIEYASSNYILKIKNNIKGYFVTLDGVFKRLLKLKLISKEQYSEFIKHHNDLEKCANYIYEPIYKLINDTKI